MPAIECEGGRHALLGEDRAHEVTGLLGRVPRVCVEEETRPVGRDGDRVAEALARLLLDLVLVELRPESLSGAVLELDRDAPVLGHQLSGGPPTDSGISGFHPARVGSRERASVRSRSQTARKAATASSALS